MSLRTGSFCLLLCAAVVLPAQAQQRPAAGLRQGTWVTAGVGGGWTRVNCSICRTDRTAGPSAALRFGTTLRPGLLVGAELDGWTRSREDARTLLTAGSAAAYIYPDPARGLFLKGGAGLVRYSFDDGDGSANLLGLMLGVGYEFPITDELNITNSVGVIASSFGALRSDAGTVADDVSISLFHIGIALTHR
ncbi:MAG TPA: hypothetical protein VFZ24_17115 [Longimicrobiales bacterium]